MADRLDVLDRFLRRVSAARRPDLKRTAFQQLPDGTGADARQRGAAERVRGARAALVEQQQVARPERRRERLGDEFAEREHGLARTAGESDHRALGWAGAR